MALLSGEGILFLFRWMHFIAGIAWIGMLYYFNFVQTPFFATQARRPSRERDDARARADARCGGSAGARCSPSGPAGC